MRIAAVLVAAGTGSRFGGDVPKQFLPLCGIPVVRHAAAALAGHVDLIQPVGDPRLSAALEGIAHLPPVPGGVDRQESVRRGLEALVAHAPDVVLIHDGARPVIPAGTIAALRAALVDHPGAIPALPVTDTLKRGEDGRVTATVPRAGLFRAQTPQAFRFAAILDAHRNGPRDATDDASLLEAMGQAVALVDGAEENVKITRPEDLTRVTAHLTGMLTPRVGTGFDVHRFAADRPLVLCGITVPHSLGLSGHSDADVGIHALCDAIYGALAEGDIGRHFPPSQERWKDADSAQFLTHAAGRIVARGGVLAHADVTLICEQPKIGPHADAMRARLAELLNVEIGRVSVKATTTERLGFTGRGEGIAAQTAVTLLLPG